MEKSDRDYQCKSIGKTIASIHDRPILVSPTGSGKTYMAVAICNYFQAKILWLAHRQELVHQAYDQLTSEGAHAGVIMAGHAQNKFAPVQVASVQTLVGRETPECDIVVVDECHHAIKGSGYERFCELGVPLVGLTATPFRHDGIGLGDFFGKIIVATTAKKLVDQGYLVMPKIFCPNAMDLNKIKATKDRSKFSGQLRLVDKRADGVGNVVTEWIEKAYGLKTVVYCKSIKRSKEITQAFIEAGIKAEHVDGFSSDEDRKAIPKRLRSGETKVVCNSQVFLEGWDMPELECLVFENLTESLAVHIQRFGRLVRPAQGKAPPVLLDLAGNCVLHGTILRQLEYSLDGTVRVKEQVDIEEEPDSIWQCMNCHAIMNESHEVCPECGHSSVREQRIVMVNGKLCAMDDLDIEFKQSYLDMAKRSADSRGVGSVWAMEKFKKRFGHYPIEINGALVNPLDKSRDNKKNVYEHYMQRAEEKGYAKGWASRRYRDIFGVWPKGMSDYKN